MNVDGKDEPDLPKKVNMVKGSKTNEHTSLVSNSIVVVIRASCHLSVSIESILYNAIAKSSTMIG
jgi:hypothetical protein